MFYTMCFDSNGYTNFKLGWCQATAVQLWCFSSWTLFVSPVLSFKRQWLLASL